MFGIEFRVNSQGLWRTALARFFKNPPTGFLVNIRENEEDQGEDVIAYEFDGAKDISDKSKGYDRDRIVKATLKAIMNFYLIKIVQHDKPQFWGLTTALSSGSINQYLVHCNKLRKSDTVLT